MWSQKGHDLHDLNKVESVPQGKQQLGESDSKEACKMWDLL